MVENLVADWVDEMVEHWVGAMGCLMVVVMGERLVVDSVVVMALRSARWWVGL